MASYPRAHRGSRSRRAHLAQLLGLVAVAEALAGAAGASTASADVVTAGGGFQSAPTGRTTSALRGTLNTVSASVASSGSNRVYRTQDTTPANLLGGLLSMQATEGITSATFSWSQSSPQTLVASYDRGASFSGLLGVDADAGIGICGCDSPPGTPTAR